MQCAHRAAAIFPFPTRCLVTGPAAPSLPSRGSNPRAAGSDVHPTQAGCLAWPDPPCDPTYTHKQAGGGGGVGQGVIDRTKDLPFLPGCLSFQTDRPREHRLYLCSQSSRRDSPLCAQLQLFKLLFSPRRQSF